MYRVDLDDPIVLDPEFKSDEYATFYMSHWGTVREVVEENVALTVDEAKRVMARYAIWVDDSAMFDGDGYATVPPTWRDDTLRTTKPVLNIPGTALQLSCRVL